MGMPISIDIPAACSEAPFTAAFKCLEAIDNRFSLYKLGSELSKFRRGEIKQADLSAEMKNVMRACKRAEKDTVGYFSAYFDSKFNPTGYIKGYGIKEAGEAIEKAGYKTYCIGAGGDILARSNSDKVWNIGIQDPRDRSKILNTLSIFSGAVATSGTYERGPHIINPKTGQSADELLSMSVVGKNIIKADIFATAAFAMDKAGISFMNRQAGYECLAVALNGVIYMSGGMLKLLNHNRENNLT